MQARGFAIVVRLCLYRLPTMMLTDDFLAESIMLLSMPNRRRDAFIPSLSTF